VRRQADKVNRPDLKGTELKTFLKVFAQILIGLSVICIIGHALFGQW